MQYTCYVQYVILTISSLHAWFSIFILLFIHCVTVKRLYFFKSWHLGAKYVVTWYHVCLSSFCLELDIQHLSLNVSFNMYVIFKVTNVLCEVIDTELFYYLSSWIYFFNFNIYVCVPQNMYQQLKPRGCKGIEINKVDFSLKFHFQIFVL